VAQTLEVEPLMTLLRAMTLVVLVPRPGVLPVALRRGVAAQRH
jgi:hypothetical protein